MMSAVTGQHTHEHQRRMTIGLAVLGVFVTYVPITAVAVTLTTIGGATGATTTDMQWITDAYVLPMAAVVLSAGVWGDLHGRRRIYLIGMVLTVLGATTAGLAATLADSAAVNLLMVGQAVSGLGAGLLLPTTLALIAHAVPDPRERGKYIGMWATGMMAGLALGPLIAGTILRVAAWGWIFVPTGVLALVAAGGALSRLPESSTPEGRHLDWPGQITATLAIAASIFGIIEGGAKGWDSPEAIAGLVVGACAFLAFVVAEKRSSSPLMDLSLFRSSTFSAAGFSALVALFSIVGTMFLLSLFLGYAQELSPLEIGTRLLFVTGVGALVNPLVGHLMHRVRAINVLIAGLVLAAVGAVSISGIDTGTGFGDLAWRLAVFGVSVAMMMTAVSTAAINAVPWQRAGMAAASNTAMRQYGGALGPAILGAVFTGQLAAGASHAESLRAALLVNATLLVVAAVACVAASLSERARTRRTAAASPAA
ncbi:MFS transporter [Mumia sp. ZJ430]|uniref:MFS transporter n=1 Tax=Mumia sp. ZJ430 TaxID=2708083 RepID=UPI001AB029AF|nr:MFS transporter [Mumia sp. ZJ430]